MPSNDSIKYSTHIRLKRFDAPTGIVGPNARRVGGWHYGIWNALGFRVMGGTCGPDLEHAKARTRRFAAAEGIDNPSIEVISP